MRMSRKHMTCMQWARSIGMANKIHYLWCSWGLPMESKHTESQFFRRFRLIHCAYVLLRYLKIWRFSCGQQQQQQQTYKLIALPLAHAHGVKIKHIKSDLYYSAMNKLAQWYVHSMKLPLSLCSCVKSVLALIWSSLIRSRMWQKSRPSKRLLMLNMQEVISPMLARALWQGIFVLDPSGTWSH